MYISELAQEDLAAKAKELLPKSALPIVEKVVETYKQYRADKKKAKAGAPPAQLTISQETPSGPRWVVPVVIGTVAVGGLGLIAWLLLRKKAA